MALTDLPSSTAARLLLAVLLGAPVIACVTCLWHWLQIRRLRRAEDVREARPPGPWAELVVIALQLAALGFGFQQLKASRVRVKQSGFAKIDIGILDQAEWITLLAVWGCVALAAGSAAVLLCWALRQRRIALLAAARSEDAPVALAWRTHPGPELSWIALATVACGVGFWRVGAATVDFLVWPPHQRLAAQLEAHFETTTSALERSVAELFAALVVAGIAIFAALLLPARRRSKIAKQDLPWPVPSRGASVAFLLACSVGAATLSLQAQPLVEESQTPIPMTHAFANASLGISPALGVRGIGPDPLPEGPWIVLEGRAARVDGVEIRPPSELALVLRRKRQLFSQLHQSKAAPTDALVTVAPDTSAAALRVHLAAARSGGIQASTFVLSDVQNLQRPVLGRLVGVRFTGLRVALAANADQCPATSRPVLDLRRHRARAGALLETLLTQTERGRACLIVGSPDWN